MKKLKFAEQRLHSWTRFYAQREILKKISWGIPKEKWLLDSINEIRRLTGIKFKDIYQLEKTLKDIWENYLSKAPTETPFCRVCGRQIDPLAKSTVWHHLIYAPETIIPVHKDCHYRIHYGTECPELKPKGWSKMES